MDNKDKKTIKTSTIAIGSRFTRKPQKPKSSTPSDLHIIIESKTVKDGEQNRH